MISKIMMFAMSIASRGLDNKTTDLETKKLRHVSCFGLDEIKSCPKLIKSTKSDFYYCGGCGCGDHPHTWLEKNLGEYSKLDYPHLTCPLKMPGFSNYDPNNPLEDFDRKKQIEQMPPENLKFVELTVSCDLEKQELLEKLLKIIKDS
jgi:hypothetical protein